MRRDISYILFFAVLILLSGCKHKNETTIISTTEEIPHQPVSSRCTAKYDRSKPIEKIDIESAISTSSPIRLSEVASTIEYFQVGDDKYPITDVVAVDDGFIILNKPKLYLYRQGKKRKRIGLKTIFNDWYNSGQNIFYDKETTRLYTQLKKFNHNTGYSDMYICELPPLDSVLARKYYLYADSLPTRYLLKNNVSHFTSKICYWDHYFLETSILQGVSTFNMKNDTICRFEFGIDSIGEYPRRAYYSYTNYNNLYLYENKPTYVVNFCDTIYRLLDHQTICPVYYVHLGKYRLPAAKALKSIDLDNKAWVNGFEENQKGVFMIIFRKGTNEESGWLKKEKDTKKKIPNVNYQVVYLKESHQTKSLPLTSKGLINDLDEGLPFWPDGQTNGYMYMIRPATELKKQIKLTGSSKQKALKAFLSNLPDNQNVMIVVK